MRLPFCDYHISMILNQRNKTQMPLDQLLSLYFRKNRSIGSHDRKKIGEILYTFTRYQTLFSSFEQFSSQSLKKRLKDLSIPEYQRLGLNEFLYTRFIEIFGPEKMRLFAKILNQNAPTTIRANALKTTRDELMELWKDKFICSPCQFAPLGIQFQKREPLFSLPEFKQGFFEMQDEGSQMISHLVQAEPGEHFLDYCSGSGGKTLAIAPNMQGKGQIYLNDKRPWILLEARKRLRRAGVQNVQFTMPRKKVDWLLLDVPCSGTGTLRRNPDAKWKIDSKMVERLVKEQRDILKEALPYLKEGGRLVYATCSLLPEENEAQVEYFLHQTPLVLEKEPLVLPPLENGMDGFFAAVFKKRSLL